MAAVLDVEVNKFGWADAKVCLFFVTMSFQFFNFRFQARDQAWRDIRVWHDAFQRVLEPNPLDPLETVASSSADGGSEDWLLFG